MRVEIMSTSSLPQPENLRLQLARKLVFTALIVLVAALALALLIQQLHSNAFFLQIFWSDILLGLVCGFTSRFVFRKNMGSLRYTAACAVYIFGLLLLGVFTGWRFGIDPIKSNPKGADWADLGQLISGMGIIALSLLAWYRPVLEVEVTPQTRQVVPMPIPRTRRAPVQRPRRTRRPRSKTAPVISATSPTPTRPKRKRLTRRKSLQLSSQQEHRCPYCLELVEPHDPRGIVECKVCHTLHHADCWAITGTCQVPHLNS
jgi:hypothetical protein